MKERKLKKTDEQRKLEKDFAKVAMKKFRAKLSQDGIENEKAIYNERIENRNRIRSSSDNQTEDDPKRKIPQSGICRTPCAHCGM